MANGRAYYNEIDKAAAAWLRNLVAAGLIPAGDVDDRSIADVQPDDLRGYTQCHFFAGIGGWALAARLAGWPDDRELWTGSCPCQPFSVAGKGAGTADERHLWPHQLRLLRARRPAVWVGEQVAAAVGKDWLDGVLADLEGIDYAGRAVVVPACAVDGPHRRDRLWIAAERAVGDAVGTGLAQRIGESGFLRALGGEPQGENATDADCACLLVDTASVGPCTWPGNCEAERHRLSAAATDRDGGVEHADFARAGEEREQPGRQFGGAGGDPGARVSGALADSNGIGARCKAEAVQAGKPQPRWDGGRGAWNDHAWIIGHDGKARRIPKPESGIRLLAHGVSGRMAVVRPGFEAGSTKPEALHWYERAAALKGFGNAIVPELAAEVLRAYLDVRPS